MELTTLILFILFAFLPLIIILIWLNGVNTGFDINRKRNPQPEQQLPGQATKNKVFKKNEHTENYYDLIKHWKTVKHYGKGEWHHIIPIALGGRDSKKNIVKVPLKVHLELHELLPKMCIHDDHRDSMQHAVNQMHKINRYKNTD